MNDRERNVKSHTCGNANPRLADSDLYPTPFIGCLSFTDNGIIQPQFDASCDDPHPPACEYRGKCLSIDYFDWV